MGRILTAVVVVPLLYLYVARLGALWFHGLIGAVGLLALHEFFAMTRLRTSLTIAGMGVGAMILATAALNAARFPIVLLCGVALLWVVRLFAEGDPQGGVRESSTVTLGILYVPGLLTFQMALRNLGAQWIFILWVTVWVADSLALYVGTFLGRRKLYPSMSPNKTVEGAIGSLAGGSVAMLAMNQLYGFAPLSTALFMGLCLSVAAQIGDLVESMFKRDAGVKDSSALVPGHGGVLDKLDAALFAAPILFFFAASLQ